MTWIAGIVCFLLGWALSRLVQPTLYTHDDLEARARALAGWRADADAARAPSAPPTTRDLCRMPRAERWPTKELDGFRFEVLDDNPDFAGGEGRFLMCRITRVADDRISFSQTGYRWTRADGLPEKLGVDMQLHGLWDAYVELVRYERLFPDQPKVGVPPLTVHGETVKPSANAIVRV